MKKMLSLLLVFTLVLSMATSAFAAEGTDCGEQPQDQEDQTAPTVSTLEELQDPIHILQVLLSAFIRAQKYLGSFLRNQRILQLFVFHPGKQLLK